MGRRLVQRRAAEEDIAEQIVYLAGERPAVARRYAIALEDAFERLRTMPDVGVLRSYGHPRAALGARYPADPQPLVATDSVLLSVSASVDTQNRPMIDT